jgi:hypothetical protein
MRQIDADCQYPAKRGTILVDRGVLSGGALADALARQAAPEYAAGFSPAWVVSLDDLRAISGRLTLEIASPRQP